MGTVYDIPRIPLSDQVIKDLSEGKEVEIVVEGINTPIIITKGAARPQITAMTAEQVKYLLKTTIENTLKIEDKNERMKLLPHILDGIDLFELKR